MCISHLFFSTGDVFFRIKSFYGILPVIKSQIIWFSLLIHSSYRDWLQCVCECICVARFIVVGSSGWYRQLWNAVPAIGFIWICLGFSLTWEPLLVLTFETKFSSFKGPKKHHKISCGRWKTSEIYHDVCTANSVKWDDKNYVSAQTYENGKNSQPTHASMCEKDEVVLQKLCKYLQ